MLSPVVRRDPAGLRDLSKHLPQRQDHSNNPASTTFQIVHTHSVSVRKFPDKTAPKISLQMGSFFQNEPICKRLCKRHKLLSINPIKGKLLENKMGSFRGMAHLMRPLRGLR